ncbi:transposase [Singulisphaera sp. GP187]|uniref:transposase n=1 Tax=Singulisphaera sp. GP187 TaxID=1882752 RepID=UPI000940F401|nr:transposase [Singulisphaera sp. GP187]
MELLVEHGFDGIARAVTVLLNEVMKLERMQALGGRSLPAVRERAGHANEFMPKTFHTRLGGPSPCRSATPGGRVFSFAPGEECPPLEKSIRSERAWKLAVTGIGEQGDSTREVAAITEQLCGLEVTSGQISRAAAMLADQLRKWRDRPLGGTSSLILDARYDKVCHGGSLVSCAILMAIGSTPKERKR